MPNIKSAMKRVKVSQAKRLRNKMKKSELRTAIRRYREALDSKADNSEALLKAAIKSWTRQPQEGYTGIPPPERSHNS